MSILDYGWAIFFSFYFEEKKLYFSFYVAAFAKLTFVPLKKVNRVGENIEQKKNITAKLNETTNIQSKDW